MPDFLMPKLSDTMEEGTVLQWLVADGSEVAKGQPLVEIETDKANMTVEAPAGGVLSVIAAEGETRDVGEPIATIAEGAGAGGDDGASPSAAAEAGAAGVAEDDRTEIPVGDDGTAREIGAEIAADPGGGERYPGAEDEDEGPSAPEPVDDEAQEEKAAAEGRPVRAAAPPAGTAEDGARLRSSPVARRRAAELGVDLAGVRGTGPDGRIVKRDVEAAAGGGDGHAAAPAAPEPPRTDVTRAEPGPAAAVGPGERTPLSRLQRTIARRMVESTTGAPHFYLQRDVDATALLDLRRELVELAGDGPRPSVNDLVVAAVARAAAADPKALRRFDDDALVAAEGVHVGIAVAVPDGLLVPVIRDADRLDVAGIAAATRDLAERARAGELAASELEGSSISISNLGMFGIDRFFAVLNPPEPAILAVGAAAERPVAWDGRVVVRTMMTLTLSVDHRALYGAEGAQFLGAIAENLERPLRLVL